MLWPVNVEELLNDKKAFELDVCTRSWGTIAISQAIRRTMGVVGAVRMRYSKDVSVCLRKFGQGGIQRSRFAVDMHLQKLNIKSVEMRNMRNEIHEVGKLILKR